MRTLETLTGQVIQDVNDISYEVGEVKIGEKVIPDKRGIIAHVGGKTYNSIFHKDYILITHKEIIEAFESELKKHYDGELEERLEINGLRMRKSYILKDYEHKVSDMPYELNTHSQGIFKSENDKIAPILSIENSIDGTRAIQVTWGIYRFFCKNILEGVFKSALGLRIRHNSNKLKENIIEVRMELIMEVIKLIMNNMNKLTEIKLNGYEFAREFADYIGSDNSEIIFGYLTKIRGDFINKEISLWEGINEITYLTTHFPKYKSKSGRKKYILRKNQVQKANQFLYNLLEKNLNTMYQELNELLGVKNNTKLDELTEESLIEV